MASLFDPGLPLNPLEPWIADLSDDQSQTATGIVAELVQEFLHEFRFAGLHDDRTILLDTADGRLGLHQIGDGFQSLIAFIGDLLYQVTNIFEELHDPLSARGQFLIDSVGNELHPRLQRRLLDFLEIRLPNMQIVVTTQSLVISQQSPENALHYCIRRDGAMKIEQFEGEPRKLRLNQLMMTEAFGDGT